MIIDKHSVGVQSLFFIGSMGATATILTQIRSKRTEGLEIVDITPTEYVVGIDQRQQTELRRVTVSPNIYNDSLITYNFANNVPIAATGLNESCDYTQKYIVFIADTYPGSDKCYVLYDMNSVGGRKIPYKKDNPTVITVNLEANKRDYSNQGAAEIIFKGTLAACETKLGIRNPLT